VPDSGEDDAVPARIAGGGLAHGRHRDQPVGLAADEQDRDADAGHLRRVPLTPAENQQQGPRGGEEHPGAGRGGGGRGRVAPGGHGDFGLDQLRIGPGRVGEAQLEDPLDRVGRRDAREQLRDGHLAQAGQRVQQELGGHRPVWLLRRQRERGIDQDHARGRRRAGGGLQDADHAAHGVADQDGRRADDLGDEPVDEARVGVHRGAAARARGQAEAVQVQRHRAAARRQVRAELAPVQVRAAQAVHQHDRRLAVGGVRGLAAGLGGELDPVDGAVQVGDVALRAPGRGVVPGRRARRDRAGARLRRAGPAGPDHRRPG
jgi:hypothetical protein